MLHIISLLEDADRKTFLKISGPEGRIVAIPGGREIEDIFWETWPATHLDCDLVDLLSAQRMVSAGISAKAVVSPLLHPVVA